MWALGVTMLEWRQISPFSVFGYHNLSARQITSVGAIFEAQWPEASGFLSALLEPNSTKRLSLARARYFLNLPEIDPKNLTREKIHSYLSTFSDDTLLVETVTRGLLFDWTTIPNFDDQLTRSIINLIRQTNGNLFPRS
jgi:hypothetical protein